MDEPDRSDEAAIEALEAVAQLHLEDPDLLAIYPEVDNRLRWTGTIVRVYGSRAEQVAISDDLAVPSRLRIERGTTVIEMDASGEHPRYRVTFETRSPAVLKRFHVQEPVEQALAKVAIATKPTSLARPASKSFRQMFGEESLERFKAFEARLNAEYGPLPVGTRVEATEEAKQFVRRRTSLRAMDRAAQQAAEVYPSGGITAVMDALIVSDRQAWRYVQRAQQLGLLERRRAPRARKAATS